MRMSGKESKSRGRREREKERVKKGEERPFHKYTTHKEGTFGLQCGRGFNVLGSWIKELEKVSVRDCTSRSNNCDGTHTRGTAADIGPCFSGRCRSSCSCDLTLDLGKVYK